MIYTLLENLIFNHNIKYITLSIYKFNDLLQNVNLKQSENIELITIRDVIKTGYYANIFGTQIHVSHFCNKESLKIGTLNNDKIYWSANIPIDILTGNINNLDRILNLQGIL